MELTALVELLYIYMSPGKGKSVMPHNEEHSEPVMCSKCNILFSTERDYNIIIRYIEWQKIGVAADYTFYYIAS